jgi:hypothetical protein
MWYRTTDLARWGNGNGAGTGGLLTALQGDENVWQTRQDIAALQAAIPAARGIADITVSGASFTVLLQDSSILGPFPLPVPRLRPRGTWSPTTSYSILDLVIIAGVGLFMVNVTHTSQALFDPNYQIGGSNVYDLLVPTGILADVVSLTGSSHTPTVAQAGIHFRSKNATGMVVTLPGDGTAPIPVRTVYQYEQASDGPVIFIPEGPTITVNKPPSRDYRSAERSATVAAIKVDTNEWTLGGYLALLEAA